MTSEPVSTLKFFIGGLKLKYNSVPFYHFWSHNQSQSLIPENENEIFKEIWLKFEPSKHTKNLWHSQLQFDVALQTSTRPFSR